MTAVHDGLAFCFHLNRWCDVLAKEVRILLRAVHFLLCSWKCGSSSHGSSTRYLLGMVAFSQVLCHVEFTSKFSSCMVLPTIHIGLCAFKRVLGMSERPLWIGRSWLFTYWNHCLRAWFYLRMEGGVILESTGNHGSGVGRRVPVMVCMVTFRITSISFIRELWDHVGEQYSAAEYTRANEAVRSVIALDPQLIPASLMMMLILDLALLANLVMCYRYVRLRCRVTPRYMGDPHSWLVSPVQLH